MPGRFIDGGLLPHPGAFAPKPKPAWAKPAPMPHVVHAEGGRSGAEGMPDQLKDRNKEEAAKQAVGRRLGFGPDGRANGGTTAEHWDASGRWEGTTGGWGWGNERP